LFYEQKCDGEEIMSGDSVPWVLPLSRFATNNGEATNLFRELRAQSSPQSANQL
jgi:hypothetical protein